LFDFGVTASRDWRTNWSIASLLYVIVSINGKCGIILDIKSIERISA
jgi:hypothetical protein